MNHSRNRTTRLAVLSLMLIGIVGLFTLSGWPKAQAINLFRATLSHPVPDQLMRLVAPNATSFPITSGVPNASAHVAYVFDFGAGVDDPVFKGSSIFTNAITGTPLANGGAYNGVTFTNVPIGTIDASPATALNGFDTVLLYQVCSIGSHPVALGAINTFLANGGKVMIFDSDRCAPPGSGGSVGVADYSGFLFPFTITGPGPTGGSGSYTFVEPSTLTAGLSLGLQPDDAVADANVFTSAAGAWCTAITATNERGDAGRVEAYARTAFCLGQATSRGLAIYSGEDFWFTFLTDPTKGPPLRLHLKTVFDNILAQAFNPDGLPCANPASGIRLDPATATNHTGTPHTVTATVVDINSNPQAGVTVTFKVTSGPDAGLTGTGMTNGAGHANFTFTDTTVPGMDVVEATFTDHCPVPLCRSCANKTWVCSPPMITCPANITQPTDPGKCTAIVNYKVQSGGDCPGATVTCNPPSGAAFPKGVTTVTCKATDNTNNMATCSFTVTVVDQEKPKITCPKDITTTTCDDSVVITYPPPVVSDNCPGVTFACVPPSSSAFPAGVTTVTCTATDTSGNQNSCAFKVTVETVKCHTICFRSPQFYLLNLNNLPRGEVLIGGVNSNVEVSTNNIGAIRLALQGNALGFGTLTPLQQLNQEFVAAQLSLEFAGGDGSPVAFDALWSPLHAYGLNLGPIPLSNGFTFTRDSMLKDVFMQARSAIFEDRKPDMVLIANLLDLLNGDNPLGVCGPTHPIADLVPIIPDGFSSFCAFFTSAGTQFLLVTIKNQGDATAAATTTAVAFGNAMVTVATPSLLPNQTVDLDVAVPTGGGPPVTIKITADVGGTLLERSNSNNVVTVKCP